MSAGPSPPHATVPFLWPFKRVYYGWGIVTTSLVISFAHAPMYGPMLSIFVKRNTVR